MTQKDATKYDILTSRLTNRGILGVLVSNLGRDTDNPDPSLFFLICPCEMQAATAYLPFQIHYSAPIFDLM
jgi:hypothetical protein